MIEQKKLSPGKYEVVEIPKGRRNVVVVQKEGDSARILFIFNGFMGRYYTKGSTFESDKTGKIKEIKTVKIKN